MSSSLPPVRVFSDEWALLQLIKKWKPEDIRKAVDDDVDLASLLLGNSTFTRLISGMAKRNQSAAYKYLSPENILVWFSVRRPDLYLEIMKNPKGSAYIQRNFDKARYLLFK